MKTSTAKLLHGVFAAAALLVYLSFPFISLGGKIAISGGDLIDKISRFGNNNFWIYAFLIFPIFALLASIVPNPKKNSCLITAIGMFVPVVLMFGSIENNLQVESGFVIYVLISICMVIFASISGSEEEEPTTSYQSLQKTHHQAEIDEKPKEIAQQFDEEKLNEIVTNASVYNPQLVAASEKELNIRKEADILRPVAEQKSDEELLEIIQGDPSMYNPAMVYCCNEVMNERIARQEEEEQRLREEEEARLEKEAEEERILAEQKRLAKQTENAMLWKEYRIWIYLALILLAVLGIYCYWQSDTHRYRQGSDYMHNNQPEKAIEYFAMLSNPKSSHYSESKYWLAKLYMGKKEYDKAAEAWKQSVITGKWEYPQAYRDYAELCLSGWMAPQIPQNKIAAANIYKNSPDIDEQLKAAELYFEEDSYRDAYKLFSQYSERRISKGYIGIMHLYGKAGLEKNAETAWNYLKEAPDMEPFFVYKGDLTLYCNESGLYNKIDEAKEYYKKAMERNSEREDYAIRYRVLNQLAKAKKRGEHTNYWNRGAVYWDYYSFPDGTYTGEVTSQNNSKGANGWGFFKFKNKELNIGHFQWLKNSGECLRILPSKNGIYMEIGEYRNDQLIKGFTIDTDGFISEKGM